jgi:cytoskeletal protein CcmA (bactofilin family)
MEGRAMFGNDNGTQKDSMDMTIYMGQNMEFKGTLTFQGTGRVDGKVEGKIEARGVLNIGEGAMVSFEIEGDTIVIGGKVEGKIIGRQRVQLLRTAVVNADIVTPSFTIEEGCQFNGTCRMSGQPDAGSTEDHSELNEMRRAALATK